jgi:DNA-binding response OmpR family regulator
MRVMLVEDDPLVGETLIEALQLAGFEVTAATCAEVALEISAAHERPPSVLITDIDLGFGLNGLELATILRRRCPAVRVIYVTGRWSSMAGRHGGTHERCLFKPFDAERLVAVVREVLSEEAPMMTVPSRLTAPVATVADGRLSSFTLPRRRSNAECSAPPVQMVRSDEGEIMEAKRSGNARRESLSRRHAELEERLRQVYARPGADETEARRIKLDKLRLKDEMHRLAPAM